MTYFGRSNLNGFGQIKKTGTSKRWSCFNENYDALSVFIESKESFGTAVALSISTWNYLNIQNYTQKRWRVIRKTVFVRCEFNQEVTVMKRINIDCSKVIVITGIRWIWQNRLRENNSNGARLSMQSRRERKTERNRGTESKQRGQSTECRYWCQRQKTGWTHDRYGQNLWRGRCPCLNNAGIMPAGILWDHHKAIEKWERCIDTTQKELSVRNLLPYDGKSSGHGHIINRTPFMETDVRGAAVYGMTKNGNGFL